MDNAKIKVIVNAVMSAVFIAVTIASVGTSVAPHISRDAFFVTLSQSRPAPVVIAPIKQAQTEKPKESEAESDDDGGYEIVPVNISHADGSGSILYKNETKYTFDTSDVLAGKYPIEKISSDEPSVLILHTHATECYAEENSDTVRDTRSSDPEKNMLAVGEVICEKLKEAGVSAMQCRTAHDENSYNAAYENSKESVLQYLKKYPSIKYIIDVHRDAIETADGAMAKPVTEGEDMSLAQIMLVVGTNEAGADHPEWKKNLRVATRLQKKLIEYNEELVRPINIRSASFNQQYSPGFFLLEVGSCANTLSEAKSSAGIFAEIFAALIKNGG